MIDKKNISLQHIIVVGDKVLIKPKAASDRTNSGLYLPPGVHEKEKIHTGWVVKVGPGYAFPNITEPDEIWKQNDERVKYMPLQAKEGDLALYLQRDAFEIIYGNEKYFIVPHSSILLLVREDGWFE
ncbi:MAG: co-chaperone GroES family protein [Cytophagaceae bacterium]|nr:co-chaperone GroES family protein [Cytophagaceae bacterium]MDW8456555.1 co-chaperone GroES family protein [Cytophagaceae bacterium]